MSQPPVLPERKLSINCPSSSGPSSSTTTGPKITIPTRSSSKRKVNQRPLDIEEQHSKLVKEINTACKKLAPSSSFDSNFWSSKANLLAMDSERIRLYTSMQFQKYQEEGGILSRERWEEVDQKARECIMEKVALAAQSKIAMSQAEKLEDKGSRFQEIRTVFVKLFNSSKLGFGLEQASSKSRRETSDQSIIRTLMKQAYCPDGNALIWEPVLGQWVDNKFATAAHLFPWQSADMMDSIFGPGSRDELFSATNGIFLHPSIEKAFDRGFLAIVPDIGVDPKDPLAPWEDKEERHKALRKWETSQPREYRIALGFETLAGLDGRRLVFRNDARPRARYVWWAFLSAITQLSWKGSVKTPDSLIQKEVLQSTRFWGTHGKYVKKNMLLGFVQEIGHDVSSIAESIMEHAIDEDTLVGTEADQTGLAIVAENVIRRAQQHDGVDYDSELEEEEDEEEDD
ncbi:hypothetical protein B0H67DRAFT_643900 [Lasiosphaeris hirsuta]|uniref:HNH nuclease domain-containing protein n=1 Tax=Lasiosphaeris hirsuta TaxID=260670 RepID=A0AA40ARI5_9PEZI|nr:hypothetical protein B0H67DRAFT_643900 [Lasiosphaeris hirsuta]